LVSNKSFVVILLQLLQTLLAAITIIFIARLLGASEYGRYVYLITASSILPLFAGLGFEHVFIMEASKHHRLIPFLFGNSFFIRLIVTTSFLITFIVALLLFGILDFWVVLLITAGSLIAVFSNPLFLSLYRVKGLHIRPWLISLITPLSFIFFLLFIEKKYISIQIVSIGFFFSNLFSIVIFLIDIRKLVKMKFSFKIFKRNYKNGFIFSISQVFDFAFARLDIFLLQFLLGSFSVGIYAAGQRVVSVFQLIPSSFHVVELPEFHRVSNDPDKLLSKFIHLRSLLLELSLLVFVPLIINANKIIALLFGNSYSEADSIVVILSFCSILLFVNYPYYMLTEAINKIKMRMYVRIISFCLTCIVVASLIKIIGLTGAAFGLLAGQLLFMILLHILTKEANGGFELILKDFKLILLAIATGYLSYFIGNLFEHVWLIVFTSSLLYLIGFFSIGHFLRYSQTTTLLFTLAKAIISKKNKFFNETKC
jgi:O-antigen/teichoic acid export membrane protein